MNKKEKEQKNENISWKVAITYFIIARKEKWKTQAILFLSVENVFQKMKCPCSSAFSIFLTGSPATCLSADFIDSFFSQETHARGFLSLYNLATVSFCRHPSLNFDLAWGIVLLRLKFCWNMHLAVFVWRNRVNNNSSCWKYKLFFWLLMFAGQRV